MSASDDAEGKNGYNEEVDEKDAIVRLLASGVEVLSNGQNTANLIRELYFPYESDGDC